MMDYSESPKQYLSVFASSLLFSMVSYSVLSSAVSTGSYIIGFVGAISLCASGATLLYCSFHLAISSIFALAEKIDDIID